MLLRPMLAFETEPPPPDIADLTAGLDRTCEPLAGLLDFPLNPEETSYGANDKRVVGSLLECVR
jgi:hypothetical protein